MLKLISWIIFLVVVLIISALSIANRHDVVFSLDPLPFIFDLPLYILLLAAGFIGLLLGSISTWLRGGATRRENRRQRREIAELKGQNLTLSRDLDASKVKGPISGESKDSPRQLEHHTAL
ncbi:lipopolysaccharide assembly protein LapA domain-containing protein [Sneathiella sp.]|uniref:lipopolysaccharide assembly protein LapA domain-containing protein n=1 Tax=Sneathiella sp. TaxID=1964365 RepID=UPI003564D8CA